MRMLIDGATMSNCRAPTPAGRVGPRFPKQQHIANPAFHEGDGRAACARIEHGDIVIELSHERLCGCIVTAGLLQRPRPGGQIIPARAPGGFRARRNDGHSGSHQIVPIVNALRIAFAHQKNNGGRVRRAVVRQSPLPVGGDQAPLGCDRIDVISQAKVTTSASRPSITERACLPDPPWL